MRTIAYLRTCTSRQELKIARKASNSKRHCSCVMKLWSFRAFEFNIPSDHPASAYASLLYTFAIGIASLSNCICILQSFFRHTQVVFVSELYV